MLILYIEEVKFPAHRAGLPGNENMIIGSAFPPAIPLRRDRAGYQADLPAREVVCPSMNTVATVAEESSASYC